MNAHFEKIVSEAETWVPFLENLRRIFQEVDREYHKAASRYGFQCQGCEDNCCLTRFYHHTLLEYLNIYKGFQTLAPGEKEQAVKRASAVRRAYAEIDKTGKRMRIMCPLNANNRCMLYDYRPMICRMHGIPHQLHHPVRGVVNGPGCHMFDETGRGKDDFRYDRTPFYASIAQLEKKLRESMGITGKMRLTVADMVADIGGKQAS
jgi:Fe-S-cluster containining protein